MVVPGATISAMFGSTAGFSSYALQIIASYMFDVIILGAWAGAFLMLIPIRAKKEIGVQDYRDPASLLAVGKPRVFASKEELFLMYWLFCAQFQLPGMYLTKLGSGRLCRKLPSSRCLSLAASRMRL